MLSSVRIVSLLALLLLPSCTAWNRSAGSTEYSTPFPSAKPSLTAPSPATIKSDRRPAPEEADILLDAPKQAVRRTPPAAVQPPLAIGVKKVSAKGVSFTFVTFDDRDVSIEIADKAGGPGSEWQSAKAAGNAHGALAAINASFFGPDGQPLGLVIENRKRFGTWSNGSSLTSGVLAVTSTSSALLRRNRWRSSTPARHLLQAGPFLLENGTVVSGLSNKSRRPRSFIAWDGNHHWALGFAKSATLAELAAALATQPVAGESFTTALNLDGGTSSDLWTSASVGGGPVSTRSFWNKPVRNYVLLKRRNTTP